MPVGTLDSAIVERMRARYKEYDVERVQHFQHFQLSALSEGNLLRHELTPLTAVLRTFPPLPLSESRSEK